MPDSLEVIDTCAFQECKNLSTVKFGNGLTRICERAFSYCKNLKEIVLPDRLERMDSYAFSYAGLESVTFGSGLNSLSNGVFANTPMQKVHIPNTVTRIAHVVFGEDIKSIHAKKKAGAKRQPSRKSTIYKANLLDVFLSPICFKIYDDTIASSFSSAFGINDFNVGFETNPMFKN